MKRLIAIVLAKKTNGRSSGTTGNKCFLFQGLDVGFIINLLAYHFIDREQNT